MIRLALVGCGSTPLISRSAAARLRGARLVAVVDDDARAARAVAEQLGAARVAGLEQLSAGAGGEFDALVVGRAESLAESQAVVALQSGLHVLMPPALRSPDEGASLAEAAEHSRAQLMIRSTLRFQPAVQAVSQSVAKGQLGAPGLLRIHRWLPAAGSWGESSESLLARLYGEIDLACWLMDGPPNMVYAAQSSRQSRYVQLHLGFAAGAMVLIDLCRGLPKGGDYFSLSVIGSVGAAYADDHHDMQLAFRGGDPAALRTGQGQAAELAELQEFVNCITEGRQPTCGVDSQRRALQTLRAAAASLDSARAAACVGE